MSAVLDIVLVLLLLGYLVHGYRLGLVRSLGALIGIAVGAVVATLAAPFIGRLVSDGGTRVIVTILAALVIVAIGHAVGAMGPAVEWLVYALGGAVAGLIVGAVIVAIVRQFTKHPEDLVVDL